MRPEDTARHEKKILFLIVSAYLFLYLIFFSTNAYADQAYYVDRMSGFYNGAWVQTAYGFTYYEPTSGFADLKGSKDALLSDAVYYRYNKAMDLFVLIYRGFQDYEPTLDGIRNYVMGLGCTGIQNANCNGLGTIQFENQTDHYRELNIAFPDREGAIIQVTVQCSNDRLLYAFGQEVFSSVIPNANADSYLNSEWEGPVGHVYRLSDVGDVYTGFWITLLDYFRFLAPSDAGWADLTGTQTALSCDAIAMYRNDSLGIVITIYYGFQPYNTTEGIYSALAVKPEYLNLHYSRCNGLKVVDFEKENSDHSIAFADRAGGIVQMTVTCSDPRLRYLYSEQLFSSLVPTDTQTVNGIEVSPDLADFLSQPAVMAGDEELSMEGSQYTIHDVDADGIQELYIRVPLAESYDGLSDIYIYLLIDGQAHYAGKLRCTETMQFPGYSSKGYYYVVTSDYEHSYFSWDVYEISEMSLSLVITFRIQVNQGDAQKLAYYVNNEEVSPDLFSSTFSVYLDGAMVPGDDGAVYWNGKNEFTFTENIYVVIITPSLSDRSSGSNELTGLLGRDIDEISSLYGMFNNYGHNAGCNEFMVYYNPICAIELFDNDQYTLSGIHPLMDIETARKILLDAGYETTRSEDVYVLKPENYYMDLNGMKLEKKAVFLFQVELPDPGGKTDLGVYLGKPVSEVQSALPGLRYEETYFNDETTEVSYRNDDVSFRVRENDEGEYVVSDIHIIDNGNNYCIDGFSPSTFSYSDLPFIFVLGSGEWYDPLHAVLFCQEKSEDALGYLYATDYSIYYFPEG